MRRKFALYPPWRRVKIAVRTTRSFLKKHLKTEDIKLGKFLNLELHKHGRKKPPHHIQVKVWKDKDTYHAEWINAPAEKPPEEKKKEAPKPEAKPEAAVEEKKPGVKIEETTTKEKLEEEKKEVLKHPPKEKKERAAKPEVKRKVKGAQKAGEMQHRKEVFSKTQKPAHEKKKGR